MAVSNGAAGLPATPSRALFSIQSQMTWSQRAGGEDRVPQGPVGAGAAGGPGGISAVKENTARVLGSTRTRTQPASPGPNVWSRVKLATVVPLGAVIGLSMPKLPLSPWMSRTGLRKAIVSDRSAPRRSL